MKGQCIYFLRLEEWLVGDIPFYLKFWAKLTHHTFQNADFRSIFTRSPSTATTSEKSSVITNGKSTTTGFPLCIHYYYAANRGSKMQTDRFSYKSGLLSKKVCYKVSLCENCQWQSCKAFTGLSNCEQMVSGKHPLLPEILHQTDPPP